MTKTPDAAPVGSDRLVLSLRDAAGIQVANCSNCEHCRHQSDGDYGEISWHECAKVERYQWLKSFPFKKMMSCWEPSFWHSKFADSIDPEEGTEYEDAIREFNAAMQPIRENR